METSTMRLYIGTYTGEKSQGIYCANLDLRNGKLSAPELAAKTTRPSFVVVHPSRPMVYAVDEVSDMAGKKTGAVRAFAMDTKTGKLTELNHELTGGPGPCYVTIDHEEKNVLVANYAGGSVSVIPILEDGKLGKPTAFVQHHGSSVNPKRQESPHAHSINPDPTNHFAVAADLGMDKLMLYRFDSDKGTLQANDPPCASTAPGAGPRHLVFSKNGKFAYVSTEMGNTVIVFAYDGQRGALGEIQAISTLPADYKDVSYAAEVALHPNGRFLYVSNRGHDSIAVFAVDQGTGKLTSIGYAPCGGHWPRNFTVDPGGAFLVVANEKSDRVVVFRIDAKTGMIGPAESEIEVGTPTCVRFAGPSR